MNDFHASSLPCCTRRDVTGFVFSAPFSASVALAKSIVTVTTSFDSALPRPPPTARRVFSLSANVPSLNLIAPALDMSKSDPVEITPPSEDPATGSV